jgi:hypothetical protein
MSVVGCTDLERWKNSGRILGGALLKLEFRRQDSEVRIRKRKFFATDERRFTLMF